MGSTSKDLLRFDHKTSSASPLAIESALLVCNKKKDESPKFDPSKKPSIAPLPKSQVLGKVKDFLGVMEEANKRLELDAKNNSQAYDIEVLDGNESEVIEMDLMLGVADLHTPEALAAAESAVAGNLPTVDLAGSSSSSSSSSETESDDSDCYEDSDNDGDGKKNTSSPAVVAKEKHNIASSEAARKNQSRKRPRIVELS